MKNKKNVGIYVHIPFCKQKCKYCDFKSYVGKENKIESYIKWLTYEIKEIEQRPLDALRYYYLPLPNDELLKNPNLKNNMGWNNN